MELYLSSREVKPKREVMVVIRDEDGHIERRLITPDFVRCRENGVIEETYTFKLFVRDNKKGDFIYED